MADLPHLERNTERFKKWLTANGIDLHRVPVDAEIYVKDDRLWYEEFKFHEDGSLHWHDNPHEAKRTTKWVFHTVRLEDI